MTSLRARLPPANALVTFEAVARHLGFTAAARELGVSQAAVSRQVQRLEAHLGVALFNRERRRVRLTAAGAALHQAVTMGFGHIASTVEGLRPSRAGNGLTVATSIAFSAFWLMARLPRFHAAHPALELRLTTSDSEADWFAEDVDAAVVFGDPGRTDMDSAVLFGDQVVAVAAPAYFAGRTPPKVPADLPGEVLLHMESPHISWLSWPDWLARCGVAGGPPLRGPHFTNYTIALQAALDGRGIALGWRRLIEPHLGDGRLVRLTDARVTPEEAYCVLVPTARRNERNVRAFRDWILREAAADWN